MKLMRGIVVSMRKKPDDWCDYKNGVWINTQDQDVIGNIKAAIRMAPDELVIESDCLHKLLMALQ